LARPLGVAFSLLAVWMIAAAASNGSRLLASRPLVFLGTISYALYLWHQALITSHLVHPSTTLGRSILIGVAVVLATLSFLLVERPANRLRHVWGVDQPRSPKVTQESPSAPARMPVP
jgi:peptidoglycan/LPS O-acetylase OafA/YrhL